MNCNVELVKKNRRYRILYIGGDYYILDIEKSIWPIFIPFLFWLMPQKIYKVDVETVKKLRETIYGSNNLATIILVSIGGSAILSRILKPVLDFSIETTMVSNVLILIIATIIIVYLRLYFRRSLSNRLSGIVDLEGLETRYIKIKPALFKQYLPPVLSHLLFVIFVFFSIAILLVLSNFIGIISYVVILPILLLFNTSAIKPGPANVDFMSKDIHSYHIK